MYVLRIGLIILRKVWGMTVDLKPIADEVGTGLFKVSTYACRFLSPAPDTPPPPLPLPNPPPPPLCLSLSTLPLLPKHC